MSWNLRDTINNDNLNETHKIFGFNSIISKDGTKILIHSKNGDPQHLLLIKVKILQM
jgi:hypothetical protein